MNLIGADSTTTSSCGCKTHRTYDGKPPRVDLCMKHTGEMAGTPPGTFCEHETVREYCLWCNAEADGLRRKNLALEAQFAAVREQCFTEYDANEDQPGGVLCILCGQADDGDENTPASRDRIQHGDDCPLRDDAGAALLAATEKVRAEGIRALKLVEQTIAEHDALTEQLRLGAIREKHLKGEVESFRNALVLERAVATSFAEQRDEARRQRDRAQDGEAKAAADAATMRVVLHRAAARPTPYSRDGKEERFWHTSPHERPCLGCDIEDALASGAGTGMLDQLASERRTCERMSQLLTGVARALKGEPGELEMHGWADLPELASNLVAECSNLAHGANMLKEQLEDAAKKAALLDAPEIHDFAKAVVLEAAHQRSRWGNDHDTGKTDADWFWLIGYLAGKALHNPVDDSDVSAFDKRLHRIVTIAAAACNWHAAKLGKTNMRPGIAQPAGETP